MRTLRRPVATAVAVLLGGAALAVAPARAGAATWSLRSPDGRLQATVETGGAGLRVAVRREGRVVLRSRLGVGARLHGRGGARRARITRGRMREQFSTPAGKRRGHRLDARRLRIRAPGGEAVELVAADDGVGLRLRGAGRERTRLRAPGGARAWMQAYRTDYEGEYVRTRLRAAEPGRYAFPVLIRARRGDWALVTEAGLGRTQAAAHLEVDPARPGALRVALPRRSTPPKGWTPWRVAVVGDLAGIVRSDLAIALGRPSRIPDASWVRPGRVAWSWWSDPRSPSSEPRQRDFVDFAAAAGWEYVLVDAGWDPAWVPRLVEYAARRGVRLMLWFDWRDLATAEQRRAVLPQVAAWGVAGVKVDFFLSDRAERIAVYEAIARAAAEHRLVVNFHGSTLPRGIQRTWPNVLTLEGVKGAEHAMQGRPLGAAHDVNLVFTRNVVGSMDYTPVTFSATGRTATAAHELALAVAYESGLQHYADSPESYSSHPAGLALLGRVPAAWDETRLVAGAPDRYAVVARRSGDRWFAAALVAGPGRLVHAPLSFLEPGLRYTARVTADDGAGGLTTVEHPVDAGTRLAIPTLPDGGFTVELSPSPAGRP